MSTNVITVYDINRVRPPKAPARERPGGAAGRAVAGGRRECAACAFQPLNELGNVGRTSTARTHPSAGNAMSHDDAAAADPDTDALGGASVSSRTRFPSTYRPAAADVFEAARAGDTARVCALVDARPELVDAADASNSTPLFYACLCGHLPTVRALLARGAGCEEATFEGERALYGALTDDIRGALNAPSILIDDLTIAGL